MNIKLPGKLLVASLFAVFFIAACTSTSGGGEQLVLADNAQVASSLRSWKKSTVEVADYQLTMWQSEAGNRSDNFSIRESFDKPRDLASYRRLTDSAGASNCVSFDSQTLDYTGSSQNPTMLWTADCQLPNDGGRLQRLYLVIVGDTKFYHLQRNWQGNVTPQALALWQQYFNAAYVCDNKAQTCPSSSY